MDLWKTFKKKAQYIFLFIFCPSFCLFRPSATWRGLQVAKHYLAKGVRWKLGNGRLINLWRDSWLPDGTGRIITRPNEGNCHLKLCDIINPATHSWDEAKIRNLLWVVDAERILQIQLESQVQEDRRLSGLSKHGNFTVRSCYHFIRDVQDRDACMENGSGNPWSDWRFIWRLDVPNKIRNFLWRVGWNILPTAYALYRRNILPNSVCVVCGCEEETIEHALNKCIIAKDTWSLIGCTNSIEFEIVWILLNGLKQCGASWTMRNLLYLEWCVGVCGFSETKPYIRTKEPHHVKLLPLLETFFLNLGWQDVLCLRKLLSF